MAIGIPVDLGGANMSAIGNSNKVTLTTTTTVSTGDRIVVCVGSSNTNRTLSSVTDAAGNTYTIHESETDVSNAGNAYIASAPCTVQLNSGSLVTATWSASVSSARAIAAFSVSSLGGADVVNGRTNTTTAWDGSSVTTNVNDEMIVTCAFRASATTSTAAANCTELFDFNGSSSTFGVVYRIVNTTGAYTVGGSWATGGSNRWMAATTAFQISSQNLTSNLSPTVTSSPSLPRVINKGLSNF